MVAGRVQRYDDDIPQFLQCLSLLETRRRRRRSLQSPPTDSRWDVVLKGGQLQLVTQLSAGSAPRQAFAADGGLHTTASCRTGQRQTSRGQTILVVGSVSVSRKTLLRCGRVRCGMRTLGGGWERKTSGLRNPAAPLSRCIASAQNGWPPGPCAPSAAHRHQTTVAARWRCLEVIKTRLENIMTRTLFAEALLELLDPEPNRSCWVLELSTHVGPRSTVP